MKHIIIGTAGHVDHGKSCLIKALTGIDPDRLKEEKKRGITIELGFAWLDLPDGGRAGIVDVPGHERFVHNMLAGAGGVDLALLIVAADEGVMPQTREHLDILQLLEVKHGILVVTKKDLVDPDWLELAEEDIREEVKGTFLETAPLFAVSSYSGEGIDELRQEIFHQIEGLGGKDDEAPMRQAIDRVFTMGGFGTVVTGTMLEGQVHVGDTLTLYPENEDVRVRSIQVHGEDKEAAYAGQRAAINLAQVSRQDVERGNVLAAPGSMDVSSLLDVRIDMLKDSPYELKNKSRVHFHHGAGEQLARVRLLGRESLKAGETAFARLTLSEPLAAKMGDHFVLRFFSPLETIGGGRILDPCPPLAKVHEDEDLQRCQRLDMAAPSERLALAVESQSPLFRELGLALRRAGLNGLSEERKNEIIQEAEEQYGIRRLTPQVFLARTFIEKMGQKAQRILEDFHRKEPLKSGLKREELRTRLLPENRIELTDRLLELFAEDGTILIQGGLVRLPGFSVELSPQQKKISQEMEEIYLKAAFAPPDTSELLARFSRKDSPEAVLSDLIDRAVLKRLDPNICLHQQFFEEARDFVIQTIRAEGELKLADFRDHIQSSRKYAVAILDAFDRERLTRLVGDTRVLL